MDRGCPFADNILWEKTKTIFGYFWRLPKSARWPQDSGSSDQYNSKVTECRLHERKNAHALGSRMRQRKQAIHARNRLPADPHFACVFFHAHVNVTVTPDF